MKRRTWIFLGAAALVVGVLGLVIGQAYFLPERAKRVDEAVPASATAVKVGTFEGAGDGVHRVSGRVQVLRVADAFLLGFEDYDQTQGPDVFVYLTAVQKPQSKSEIESGLRVLIEGGADGGESTKEGNFQQALPAAFDPADYEGVAIWCDRFDTLFGRATLAASSP